MLDHDDKRLNSSPNDKFLDWSKFKALIDDEINVTQNWIFVEILENILGKGEKCWLPACSGSLKVGIVWERVNGSARSINPYWSMQANMNLTTAVALWLQHLSREQEVAQDYRNSTLTGPPVSG